MSLIKMLAGRVAAASFIAVLFAALFAAPPIAYAAGVNADFLTQVQGTYSGSNPLGSVSFAFNQRSLSQVTSGTTVGRSDKLFSDTRTIAASSSENLDLAGVLTDPFGVVATFGHVKAIYIKASAANANSVVIGGAPANAFIGPFGDATDKISIPPGGSVLLVHPGAGWAVTGGTGDILLVGNSGAGSGVSYDIVLVGTST